MHINEDAVSFAAFSLAKVLVAELLRKGILDREELVSAISSEIAEHRKIAAATNEDAAVLLEVYRDEMPPGLIRRRHRFLVFFPWAMWLDGNSTHRRS